MLLYNQILIAKVLPDVTVTTATMLATVTNAISIATTVCDIALVEVVYYCHYDGRVFLEMMSVCRAFAWECFTREGPYQSASCQANPKPNPHTTHNPTPQTPNPGIKPLNPKP